MTLPGVDYLGKGYDGFKGNPRPTHEGDVPLDPGFNGRIFRICKDDCEEGRTLCIGNGVTNEQHQYVVPDGFEITSAYSCDTTVKDFQEATMTSYSENLEASASTSTRRTAKPPLVRRSASRTLTLRFRVGACGRARIISRAHPTKSKRPTPTLLWMKPLLSG